MNSRKFLVGTVVGGIVYFLLGYLVYGVMLADFYNKHLVSSTSSMKPMGDIIWWSLILGNFAMGALLSYIFLKLGNVGSFGSGASTGAAIGFFISLAMGLIRYGTENTFDLTATLTDVVVQTVMFAIMGGIIAALSSMGAKPK